MSRSTRVLRRLVCATATLALIGWILAVISVVQAGRRDDARRADAIVVLGAAQYEGHPSPVLKARLDHALELWSRGLAPKVIVTGGVGVGDTTSEAAVSRRYMIQHGVPDSAIAMEGHGLTTRQSMSAVSVIMRPLPSPTVIVVSDPFHMLRLSILAHRLGMKPLMSPTRTSPISASPERRWRYVLAESIKVPLALLFEALRD